MISDEYGEMTQLITLPVGTKFYVRNGDWEGEIFLKNGVKYLVNLKVEKPIKDTDYLAIDII